MQRVIEQAVESNCRRIRILLKSKHKQLDELIDVLIACYVSNLKRQFVWICDLDTERRIIASLSSRELLASYNDASRSAWLINAALDGQPTIRFARSSGLGLERLRGLGLGSSVRVFVDLDYATDLVEAIVYPSMGGLDSGLIEYCGIGMQGMSFSHFFVDEATL